MHPISHTPAPAIPIRRTYAAHNSSDENKQNQLVSIVIQHRSYGEKKRQFLIFGPGEAHWRLRRNKRDRLNTFFRNPFSVLIPGSITFYFQRAIIYYIPHPPHKQARIPINIRIPFHWTPLRPETIPHLRYDLLPAVVDNPRNLASQVFAVDDHIDKPVLKQKLSLLKAFRQLDLDRLSNRPAGAR